MRRVLLIRFFLRPFSIAVFFAANAARAEGFDHTHALYGKVLQQFLKGDRVDYKALKAGPADLNAYLDRLAAVKEEEFKKWSQSEQIAFLINLYNAATLSLIIDHYPVKSIKEIGGFFSGPWSQATVRVFGKTATLGHLEHGMLRANYEEPRIHFAVVCASIGCPPLHAEPYTADKLEKQFDEQARAFLAAKDKNSIDVQKRVANLSPIFKWFEKDFLKKAKSVTAAIQPYVAPEAAAELAKGDFKIKYTEYDWNLNDTGSRTPNSK
ncbi:MAG: DUF547 domain-containing protein [Planctomycetes bacterium]|nr:DUF547 domain-containing protein [Planctomycetota bacterium]